MCAWLERKALQDKYVFKRDFVTCVPDVYGQFETGELGHVKNFLSIQISMTVSQGRVSTLRNVQIYRTTSVVLVNQDGRGKRAMKVRIIRIKLRYQRFSKDVVIVTLHR